MQAYTEAVHHQAAATYTYGNFQGNFQETSIVLFTICVMIILNQKQFPGSSLSYLQNSTQILNREYPCQVSRNFINNRSLRQHSFALCKYLVYMKYFSVN